MTIKKYSLLTINNQVFYTTSDLKDVTNKLNYYKDSLCFEEFRLAEMKTTSKIQLTKRISGKKTENISYFMNRTLLKPFDFDEVFFAERIHPNTKVKFQIMKGNTFPELIEEKKSITMDKAIILLNDLAPRHENISFYGHVLSN